MFYLKNSLSSIIYFIVIGWSTPIYSQISNKPDSSLINFMIYSSNDNYKECIKNFKQIRNTNKLTMWDYYNAAKCATKMNFNLETLNYLEKSITLGLDSIEITSDSTLYNSWIKLKPNYQTLRKNYFATSTFNLELMLSLSNIHNSDQVIRKHWVNYRNDTTYNKLLTQVDSLNYIMLFSLIKNNGWLSYKLVGAENEYLTSILIHSIKAPWFDWSSEYWQIIINELKSALKNGNENPKTYAVLIDTYQVQVKKEKQIYGTLLTFLNGKIAISEIKDINEVDKRRQEIGLFPLHIEAKMIGAELPENYVK